MATALTSKLSAIQEEVARFAGDNISHRSELGGTSEFPWDIWRAMGEAGLLGLALPPQYGGRDGGYAALVVAGEALVRHGGNLGLALSVAVHHIVAKFLILGFGDDRQRQEYLPSMGSGKMIGCLAVSEPKTGAHPKHLKTVAAPQGDLYLLNGEKTYLTNGPIADLFVVMAVTGDEEGKKLITAFVIPKDTPGTSQTEPLALDFLRPSPHGGIKLDNASVPAANILGREGAAYETMIKPFREIEDAVLMGPIVGGMAAQLEMVMGLIRAQGIAATEEIKTALGRLQFLVHQARIIAYEAGMMLDSPSHTEFLSLLLSGRDLGARFQSELESLLQESGVIPSPELRTLTKDLTFAGNIAKNVALKKQIRMGETLLQNRSGASRPE